MAGRENTGQVVMALFMACAVLGGCAANGFREVAWETQCSDPRPQVCTMIYDPVCAALADGSRKTYSSGCNACADVAVVGFDPQPCPG